VNGQHPFTAAVEAAVRARANGDVGAGCPNASADSGADLRRDDGSVEWLLARAPRLALARALDIDFVPYPFTITCNFASTAAGQVLTDQAPNRTVSRDVLLYGIDVDIQVPTAFTGDELKPVSDFFFDFTSGIQAAVNIYGKDRRSARYCPVRGLNKFCSPDEPWVLLEEQTTMIDFKTTTVLPFAPATLTVTLLGKTPATDAVFRMNVLDAFDCLDKLGFCTDSARCVWGASR
jgi:hypothetical protein